MMGIFELFGLWQLKARLLSIEQLEPEWWNAAITEISCIRRKETGVR